MYVRFNLTSVLFWRTVRWLPTVWWCVNLCMYIIINYIDPRLSRHFIVPSFSCHICIHYVNSRNQGGVVFAAVTEARRRIRNCLRACCWLHISESASRSRSADGRLISHLTLPCRRAILFSSHIMSNVDDCWIVVLSPRYSQLFENIILLASATHLFYTSFNMVAKRWFTIHEV